MWLSILLSVMIFCNLVSSLKIYYGYTWLFFVLPFGRKQQTAVLLPLKSPCIIDGVTAKTLGNNFITRVKVVTVMRVNHTVAILPWMSTVFL